MKNNYIYFLSILFLLQSCSFDKHKQVTEIKSYLTNDLNLQIKDKHLYVVFSSTSCHSCVDSVIAKLNEQKSKNISIILSGYSEKQFSEIANTLKQDDNLIYDLRENHFNAKYLSIGGSVIFVTGSSVSEFIQFDNANLEGVLLVIEDFISNE